ncbi:Hercynine oxygenase [Vibrio stylophorae]|uniref:Hercynine oxygenase n=1 Tax=Vibrio stylophorae TaxID=659351 RepID=A0ABN8DWC8_9VIBR|nr:SUMF1/EgtB/PvdO family nonheme iron enzyme [Vibrio stylophorae]CAH0535789.1 Hercynine oxygenase [Vibrio stylophorae]
MTRIGLPALLWAALSCLLVSGYASAEEAQVASPAVATAQSADPVAELSNKIDAKQEEIKQANAEDNSAREKLAQLMSEKDQISATAVTLEKDRDTAQQQLDAQFQRMLEDPEVDLNSAKTAYQKAWEAVKNNHMKGLETQQSITEQQMKVEAYNRNKQLLGSELENLEESLKAARVLRLQDELNYTNTIEVIHTITCNENMTLGECKNQGKTLTMQKAVNNFREQLLNSVTESQVAKANAENVALNIHMLSSDIVDSRFSGESRFSTRLKAEMKSHPNQTAACRLLNLADRYCIDKKAVQTVHVAQPNSERWLSVTIRSNRFDDKVTINGLSYGSTPIEVMLPAGEHQITVEKPGFKPFSRQIDLTKDTTFWAELHEQRNVAKPGKQFSDALKGNSRGPRMVVIGSGNYNIGPKAEQKVKVPGSYSISSTPVTVNQFKQFVDNTGYITQAEKGQGCNAINNGESVTQSSQNWKNPGFAVKNSMPVVCITQNDAKAYAQWLTKQSGYQYQLPSDIQWEVAARAGTSTDYWWGNDIGVGKANSGWSGSIWSNKSPSPVASFPANPFGLYDTVGNVWEWTKNSHPVARGGAWSFSPNQARVAEKLELAPNESANYVGFRVVRSI